MNINNSSLIKRWLWIGIAFAIVAAVGLVVISRSSARSLTIKTDSLPLRLELNDRIIDVTESNSKLSLGPGIYEYRASKKIDGEKITVRNKVDLVENKSQELIINFDLYKTESVSKTLCEDMSINDCLFSPQYLEVSYLEDFQWAAVLIDNPSLGKAQAVLKVSSGKWEIVDGPGTDLRIGGYYPQSVEEVLANANETMGRCASIWPCSTKFWSECCLWPRGN